VDLERREPIELLPDRHADTLAAWLADHPSITVIARDRSPVYAEAATRGAPQAVQVADRWHILKNLQEAVQRFVTRQSHLLRQVKEHLQDDQQFQQALRFEHGSPLSSRSIKQRQATHKKCEHLHQAILDLHHQGHSQRKIAAELGVCRNRVVAYLQRGVPTHSRSKRTSMLEPYLPYMHARWLAGHRNAMQLWRDIKVQGYPGTPKMVQRYITRLRAGLLTADSGTTALRTPSVRTVTWWLSLEADALDEAAKQFVTQLRTSCPEAEKLRQMGLQFRRMMQERRAADLPGWLKEAEESGVPELKSFVLGIRQDYAAVEAAFSLEWSNGQTEGQITRLKYLKRQMYGRASFDLLRARVLHAA
jgi:transposase